jgi:hypothetical protein
MDREILHTRDTYLRFHRRLKGESNFVNHTEINNTTDSLNRDASLRHVLIY